MDEMGKQRRARKREEGIAVVAEKCGVSRMVQGRIGWENLKGRPALLADPGGEGKKWKKRVSLCRRTRALVSKEKGAAAEERKGAFGRGGDECEGERVIDTCLLLAALKGRRGSKEGGAQREV